MDIGTGRVYVLGTGHLAAALRVHLRDRQLSVGSPVPHAHMFVACADFECVPSFADANRRALAARSPLLFACLAERVVKIGPFVVPFETACFECHPAQSWDLSPADPQWRFMRAGRDAPVNADIWLMHLAQFGAALIVSELGARSPGAPHARLAGCVAKFDPPSREPQRLAWPRTACCRRCGARPPGPPPEAAGRDSGQGASVSAGRAGPKNVHLSGP
jgi:hypothetical protein